MPVDRARLRVEGKTGGLPLSVGELEARGISRSKMRGPRWRRTSYGYYVPSGAGSTDGLPSPLQRILEAVPLVPPHGALTGWAAAYLGSVPELDGRDPQTGRTLPTPICLGSAVGRRANSNVVYLRDELPETDIEVTQVPMRDRHGAVSALGARVVSGHRATFDGVRLASDLAEAVAFVDASTHRRWTHLARLNAYALSRRGARNVSLVRKALELADPASRSPWESRLRVFYITVAGLPRPMVNLPVFDLDGKLLGIPDLLDLEAGFVTEFDGGHHRERSQHRADNEREELFENAGLIVARADSLDLTRYQPRLARRLVSGHARGLQRDRHRDGWTVHPPPWWLDRYA